MLVHIIEDDELKASRILDFLKSQHPDYTFKVSGSYQSGLKSMEEETPDFVILDMTLPNFDYAPDQRDRRMRPLGGYDLMRKLKRKSYSTKVIIVTQLPSFDEDKKKLSFEEVAERCRHEFPDTFVTGIYFDQSDISWQRELISAINSLNSRDEI
ncbi:hypothetical protein ACPZMI_19455 [Pseudomonas wayambapalatensis]|uniref:hypothetical protein n=1 Tax=Pseudomonas wayambapalatensis TaxID=485895 RepID=UPI003CEC0196